MIWNSLSAAFLCSAVAFALPLSSAWAQKKSASNAGQARKPASIQTTMPQNENKEPSASRWGVGVNYSISSRLDFANGSMTGASGPMTANLGVTNSPSLQLMYLNATPESWGFEGGLTYMMEKKITEGKVAAGNAETQAPTGNDSGIQATTFYAGLNHSFASSIISFGLNYTLFNIKYATSTGSTEVTNDIGLQAGLGTFVTKNWMVDFTIWYQRLKLKHVANSGAVANYGDGTMVASALGLRYLF